MCLNIIKFSNQHVSVATLLGIMHFVSVLFLITVYIFKIRNATYFAPIDYVNDHILKVMAEPDFAMYDNFFAVR